MSNPADYAANHWRQFESADEHAERVERAEQAAGWYFNEATKPQKAAYTRAMEDLRGLSGPRYDRAREAAEAAWYASTKDAADLLNRTCDEIMRDGEMSESLGAEWDRLCAASIEKEAA